MKTKGPRFICGAICFSLAFNITTTAHAVIPQLLGPLSALVSILPQILVFVGIAVLAIFKPSTYRLLIFYIRGFALRHKAIATVLGLVIVAGFVWFVYQVLQTDHRSALKATANVHPATQSTAPRRSPSAWSAFRGGVTRTGHVDNLPGPRDAAIAWTFKETGGVMVDFSSSPAVVGDRVYIASAQGSIFSSSGAIYCLDANRGEVLWQSRPPFQIFSSPTVVGGRVYVGEGFHQDTDCHLYCLDANNGDALWEFQTTSHVESSPFVSQGKVYFGAGEDGVYCIDALEGKKIWHYPSVHVDISPAVWKGIAYFGSGYGDYTIYAVDANDGREIWSTRVNHPVWGSPSANEDMIYFGLGNGNFIRSAPDPGGGVIAVNAQTGEQIWAYEAADAVLTAVAYQNGVVYFGSRDGNIYALNATNGERRWKLSIGNPIVSSPAITENSVYVGDDSGMIYSIDIVRGNVVWRFDTGKIGNGEPIYSSSAIANGKLYVGSKEYIFCLGEKNMSDESLELEDR